jgi:NAD(P)-dependent dehydrogenase (short-subunit alcohol dehydrogenase family)
MFLRAVKPGYESGLVLLSSAAARHPFLGGANYCAAKAAVEMWVRVVKRELESRGRDTWVVAVRPGFVDTPTTRAAATQKPEDYPVGPQVAKQLESRDGVMTPEEAGRDIWSGLPPKNKESVLLFGEMVSERK